MGGISRSCCGVHRGCPSCVSRRAFTALVSSGASASRVRGTCADGTVRRLNAGSVCDATVTSAVGAARVHVEEYTPQRVGVRGARISRVRHASVSCGVAARRSLAVSSMPAPMRILASASGGRSLRRCGITSVLTAVASSGDTAVSFL